MSDAADIINKAYYSAADRTFTFVRTQDAEPIVDRNKALATTPQSNKELRHVASIPNVVIEQWLQAEWDRGNTDIRLGSPEFDKIIMKKLRDRDWLWLTTTDKRI